MQPRNRHVSHLLMCLLNGRSRTQRHHTRAGSPSFLQKREVCGTCRSGSRLAATTSLLHIPRENKDRFHQLTIRKNSSRKAWYSLLLALRKDSKYLTFTILTFPLSFWAAAGWRINTFAGVSGSRVSSYLNKSIFTLARKNIEPRLICTL